MNSETFQWPKENSLALKTRLEFVYKCLRTVNPTSILDVGCGTGDLLTQYLAKLFDSSQVYGVDSDESSIEFAQKKYSDVSNLQFFTKLPDNINFDVIIASEVIEHVEDPYSFFKSLIERLKAKGIIIITIPNGYGCSEIMSLIQTLLVLSGVYGILRKVKHTIINTKNNKHIVDTLAVSPHVNFFTLKKIRNIFINCGLKETKYQGRMFLHNFICSMIIDNSEALARLNANLGKLLPPFFVSDWMFSLKKGQSPLPSVLNIYRRNTYEKFRRYLNERQL